MNQHFPPLTRSQVLQSRALHGSNQLPQKKTISFFSRYLQSFNDPLIKILALASLIIFTLALFGHASMFELIGLVCSIVLSTMVSTISDHSNEASFYTLQKQQLDAATSLVYRHADALSPLCHQFSTHRANNLNSPSNTSHLPCTCANPFSCSIHHLNNSSIKPLPSHDPHIVSHMPFSPSSTLTSDSPDHSFSTSLTSPASFPPTNSPYTSLTSLNSRDLVVGDIVLVQQGDEVPVDGWLITGHIAVNQSTMTGEDVAVVKTALNLDDHSITSPSRPNSPNTQPARSSQPSYLRGLEDTAISSRFHGLPEFDFEHSSSVFKSTIVEEGQGLLLVFKVGKDTLCGKTLTSFNESDEQDDDDEDVYEEEEEEEEDASSDPPHQSCSSGSDFDIHDNDSTDGDGSALSDADNLLFESILKKKQQQRQNSNRLNFPPTPSLHTANLSPNQHRRPQDQLRNHKIKKTAQTAPLVRKLQRFSVSISYWAYYGAIAIALIHLFQCVVVKNNYNVTKMYHYFTTPVLFFRDVTQSIILSVIMCVVAIPEGLPSLCALVLSLNMTRLLKQSVLVRKLIGIATSGNIDYLFVDKTGTISTGIMTTETVLSFAHTNAPTQNVNTSTIFNQNAPSHPQSQLQSTNQSQSLLTSVLRPIPNQSTDYFNSFLLFCLQQSCGNATYRPQSSPLIPKPSSSTQTQNTTTNDALFIDLPSPNSTSTPIEKSLDITSLVIDDESDDSIVGGNSTDRAILSYLTLFASQHPHIPTNHSSNAHVIAEAPFSSAKKFGLKQIKLNETFTNTFFPHLSQPQQYIPLTDSTVPRRDYFMNDRGQMGGAQQPEQQPHQQDHTFDPFTHIASPPTTVTPSSPSLPNLPSAQEISASNSNFVQNPNSSLFFIKGAVELILDRCTHYYSSPPPQSLSASLSNLDPSSSTHRLQSIIELEISPDQRTAMQAYVKQMSSQGARIIAIATAPTPSHSTSNLSSFPSPNPPSTPISPQSDVKSGTEPKKDTFQSLPQDLNALHCTLCAVLVIRDQLRSSTPSAITLAKEAGIKTVIVSGDKIDTCIYFAQISGLVNNNNNNNNNNSSSITTAQQSQYNNIVCNMDDLIPKPAYGSSLQQHYLYNFHETTNIPFSHHYLPILIHAIANQYNSIALTSYHISLLSLVDLYLLLPKLVVVSRSLPQDKLKLALAAQMGYELLNTRYKSALNTTSQHSNTTSHHQPNVMTASSYNFHINGNSSYYFDVHQRGTIIVRFKVGKFIAYHELNTQSLSQLFTQSAEQQQQNMKHLSLQPNALSPHSISITIKPSHAHKESKCRSTNIKGLTSHVVGQLGDGENDCLALNAADVAFVLGDGQQSAQAVATIILLRNSILCCISAVWYGRSLFQNIRNFVSFQLAVNLGLSLVLIIGPFFSTEFPLTLGQLLFLNIVIDSIASTAIAAEPPTLHLLGQRPLHPDVSILSHSMSISVLANGIFISILSLIFLTSQSTRDIFSPGVGAWGISIIDETILQSDIFLTAFFSFMILTCSFHTINVRTPRLNVFYQLHRNTVHLVSLPLVLLLLYLFSTVPIFRRFLRTVPLTLGQWVFVIAASAMVLVFDGGRKLFSIWYFRDHPEVSKGAKTRPVMSSSTQEFAFPVQSTSALSDDEEDDGLLSSQPKHNPDHHRLRQDAQHAHKRNRGDYSPPLSNPRLDELLHNIRHSNIEMDSINILSNPCSIWSLSEQYQGEIIVT